MKVKLYQNDLDEWVETDGNWADEVELPDAIVTEWRQLTARLEEINEYLCERVPPLVAEQQANRPSEPESLVSNVWARALMDQMLKNMKVAVFDNAGVLRIVDEEDKP